MAGPQQYAGAQTSSFDQLVGGVLGGASDVQTLKDRRRRGQMETEDQAAQRRKEKIEEITAAEAGGYTINEPGAAQAGSFVPTPPATAIPANSIEGPGGITGVVPERTRMRGPQLEDEATEPQAPAPVATSSAPATISQSPTPAAQPEVRRNFLQRVGNAIGGAAGTALKQFATGGYSPTDVSGLTITKTGPSTAEAAADLRFKRDITLAGIRTASYANTASVRAAAQVRAAEIRAAAATARSTGDKSQLSRLSMSIARETNQHLATLRMLNQNQDLKAAAMGVGDADVQARAQDIRQQIVDEQSAIDGLQSDQEAVNAAAMEQAGVKVTAPPKAPATSKLKAYDATVAKNIIDELRKARPNAPDADIARWTKQRMSRDGYEVR